MKSITMRGVDEHTLKLLKEKARSEHKSMNQLLLEIIQNSLGLVPEKRFTAEYDDLDSLFGRWSEAEFRPIHDNLSEERTIDPELWQ